MDRATFAGQFDGALLYARITEPTSQGNPPPYAAHGLAVSATVLSYRGDEDLAIAALLHDSARIDWQGTAGGYRFGDRVARVARRALDSLADTAKGERKADCHKREATYLSPSGEN